MAEADRVNYLDCCQQPALITVKSVYASDHDAEALRQCQSCGAYWFYRFHEHVTFVGDDDLTVWYSFLTPEEGTRILEARDRPDLSFLSEKPSFLEDGQGVKRVQGQPIYPWS
jgi:hypothetical protein